LPSYSKLEKVNTLAALEINDGNIKKTAEEFGVSRLTLYHWKEQLDKDIQLLKMVEAAKNNFANLEELTALKAIAEINKRLDEKPDKIKDADLLKFKDSGINNSRLMRGQATSIVQDQAQMLKSLVEYCKLHANDNKTLAAMVLYAEGSGVEKSLREREAERLLSEGSQENI
jgi:transposase-like protein